MSVAIQQEVHGYSAGGQHRGNIVAHIKVTNEGPGDIFGSAWGLGFWLTDDNGTPIPGFRRTDPKMTDMTGPIPVGGGFEHEIHFECNPIDVGQQYRLICQYLAETDQDSTTFVFKQVYLGG